MSAGGSEPRTRVAVRPSARMLAGRWLQFAAAAWLVFFAITIIRAGGIAPAAATLGWPAVALGAALPLMLGIPGTVLHERAQRRLADGARAHDFLLCPRCHYPLTSQGDSAACPECGSTFPTADLPRIWAFAREGD